MTYHQICFTRLSGQGSNDGWQAVNISPQLPKEAVSAFTRFQNGNITPPVFDKEDAGIQIVTELQNSGDYVFYTLIKCNAAADDRGRSIMFSDSLVFDLNEFIKDPQLVLCIDKSNFKFDITSTVTFPLELKRLPSVTLTECVKSLGLNEQSYTTLMQCVYYILDSKTKNSLHIICDCSDEKIRNYMVCIYAALAYEFRKKVSFSTYEFPNGSIKTIIFDRTIKKGGNYYIVPETEENNVLTETIKKRFTKYEFMRVIPQTYTKEYNFDSYYKTIEDQLAKFGSAQNTSLELYKIAYDLIKDEKKYPEYRNPQEQCQRLNELLSAPISHPYLDQKIQYILSDIVEYNIELNDLLSEKLFKKIETTRNQDLVDCGSKYISDKVIQMSTWEGAKYLFNQFYDRNSDVFIKTKKNLDQSEKGREILVQLYTVLVAESVPLSKIGIQSFYDETVFMAQRSKIQETLYKLVCKYAWELAQKEKVPDVLISNINSLLLSVLIDCPEYCDKVLEYTKKMFWQNTKYKELIIDDADKYRCVVIQGNAKCRIAVELNEIFRLFKNGDTSNFGKRLNSFVKYNTELPDEDLDVIKDKLSETFVNAKYSVDELNLDMWMYIVFILNIENPAGYLIKNNIEAVCGFFSAALPTSKVLKLGKYRELFVNSLAKCVQDKKEYSNIASDDLRVIKEYDKRFKQERKKQEREEGHESREASGKESFFSNITGFFKRKNDDDGG